MRIAPPRRITQATVALILAGTVSTAGLASASATEAADSTCTSTSTSTSISKASAARLRTCITSLQKRADTAGRTAQVADEHYLKAKRAAKKADAEYVRTRTLASVAQIKAAKSRARAGAVAAHLARTGGTASQTTQVLLSGDGASKVLYNLSRMSELSVDSTQLAGDAAHDSRTASGLEVQTGLAAGRAEAQKAKARTASAKAKKESAVARGLVIQAEARQRQLAGPKHSSFSVQASVSLPSNATTAQRVLAFARSQIGDPYVFGAAGLSSWDCSGLTMGAFASAGIGIGGRGATVQYDTARSRGLLVSYSSAAPGDLVFFTDGGGDMYHVAIYSGGGMMIEAPYEGRDVREVPVRSYQLVGQVARFTG